MRASCVLLALATVALAASGAAAASCGIDGIEGAGWTAVPADDSAVQQLAKTAAEQFAKSVSEEVDCRPASSGLVVNVFAACRASETSYALDFSLRVPCIDAGGALVGIIEEELTAELERVVAA